MIRDSLISILAGLSVGLMFCLYFVRQEPITKCYSSGPFTCEVIGPSLVELTAMEAGEPWQVAVSLEKK